MSKWAVGDTIEHEAAKSLLGNLNKTEVKSVTIAANSPASGKLISELQIRTRCGASIVAIAHNGNSILNPTLEDEIQDGDQVLLLGEHEHLENAERLLN